VDLACAGDDVVEHTREVLPEAEQRLGGDAATSAPSCSQM
jgi:hypothetical protein